ncbi:MAG TPA: response regulator transcription factor [Candidatus Merdenecus merdavium]|nr:response regulator transcription factor [Candidatus Merdenecus merdavium]
MGKIKVIVVDDLVIHTRRLERLINATEDLELVAIAQSGKEAIEVATMHEPDIMLIDIQMEHTMAGIEAAQEINLRLPNIKIIILTVHKDESIIFAAFQTGIVDYILKTASDQEILDAIYSADQNLSPIRPMIAEKIRNEFQRMKESEKSILFIIRIVSKLTPSELEVLQLLAENKTRKDIAAIRCVEQDTIKKQISSILRKFNKSNYKEVLDILDELQIFELIKKI